MGCGASAEPEVEEQEEENPYKAALKEIAKSRARLKGLDEQHSVLETDLRYFETALKKGGEIQNAMEDELEDEKAFFDDLKLHIANQDALDLREASEGWGTDETKMAKCIVCRLPETIELTDQIYRRNYGRSLEDQIRGENHTLLGLLTGGMTNFGKFLCYRAMPQAKRDSLLIHKCMAGWGCSDFILVEILSTRTNQELKDAAAAYAEDHDGEDMVERIKSETGGFGKKWYGLWCDTLVEFDRDEREGVQGDPAAVAQELYDAGEGKWMGCDEQPFIDHLCKANDETVAAIVAAYDANENSQKSLFQAVEDKMGGDLEFAVLARIRPKPIFFAYRIYKACKGWGTDEECIGRVIACITKKECELMEAAYQDMYKDEEAPFNNFREVIKSELSGSFLEAIEMMMDTTSPKGHRVQMRHYPVYADQAAKYFADEVKAKHNEGEMRTIGTSDLDGCFQLCGFLDPNDLFICRDYDYGLDPARDKFEAPARAPDLMEETPADLEAAEALIEKLNEVLGDVEGQIATKEGDKSGFEANLHLTCHEFKTTDHLLNQYRSDNVNMLEFCASRDADLVNEAVVGWGTDEAKLIRVLCALSKTQLRRVNEIYTERYGKTLREVTDDELGGFFEGDFKYFMKCCLTLEAELDAELLVESMKGWGTNDTLLCEIICTRSNKELKAAKAIFLEKAFGAPLEQWVDGDTSGSYQDFLMACLKADRDESVAFNWKVCETRAEMIHNVLEGTSEYSTLTTFLPRMNVKAIEQMKKKYYEKYGVDMMADIKEKGSGDWQKILLARCYDKPSYYAHALMGAMKGWGTDETALSRIIGRASKGDLKRIEARFQAMFDGQTLSAAITSEVGGNFKKALLTYLSTEAPGAPEEAPAE